MNRKVLLKLIVCDAALALLILGYSVLFPFGTQPSGDIYSSQMSTLLYLLIYGEMAMPIALVLLVTAFTWTTYRVTSPCKRWQLVMVLNALICSVVSAGVSIAVFNYGQGLLWFFFTLPKMLFWTGLMTIVLSFPMRLLKRKGLVA